MSTIDTNKLLDELQELSINFLETFRDGVVTVWERDEVFAIIEKLKAEQEESNKQLIDMAPFEQAKIVQVIRNAKSLDDAVIAMNGLAANGWLNLWKNSTHPDGSSYRDLPRNANYLRDNFEQAVYKRYFISQINLIESRLTLDYNTKTLAELCAKDDAGEYLDKDISAMWFGYNIDKTLS